MKTRSPQAWWLRALCAALFALRWSPLEAAPALSDLRVDAANSQSTGEGSLAAAGRRLTQARRPPSFLLSHPFPDRPYAPSHATSTHTARPPVPTSLSSLTSQATPRLRPPSQAPPPPPASACTATSWTAVTGVDYPAGVNGVYWVYTGALFSGCAGAKYQNQNGYYIVKDSSGHWCFGTEAMDCPGCDSALALSPRALLCCFLCVSPPVAVPAKRASRPPPPTDTAAAPCRFPRAAAASPAASSSTPPPPP